MTAFRTTRRSLLTLIGGLSIFRPARSGQPETFTLIPNLSQGQVLRYRQEVHQTRNGAVAHRTRSVVKLEILDRTAGGWLARWVSSEADLLEADPQMRPILEAMLAWWDNLGVDLVLGEGGQLVGLADPLAVRAQGEASLDRLLAMLLKDPEHATIAGPLRAAMQRMLSDYAVFAQSLLKEPAILLGAMGLNFKVGKPLEVRTRIPSPTGDGEIPILGRYQVAAYPQGIHAPISVGSWCWTVPAQHAPSVPRSQPSLRASRC